MYRTKDFMGKDIHWQLPYKQSGVVKDIICQWDQGIVKGIIVETGIIFNKSNLCISLDVIKRVAGEWFIVEPLDAVKVEISGKQWSQYFNVKVVTNWGHETGYMTDILFSIPGGAIEFLEVSDGFLKDFINGKTKIPYRYFETITPNLIIVQSDWR
ncbi:MAG: hypothetical protein AB1420_01080 [Bacillota bacterium]